jgi:hypothetical protein
VRYNKNIFVKKNWKSLLDHEKTACTAKVREEGFEPQRAGEILGESPFSGIP